MRGWRWAGDKLQQAGECEKHLHEMQQAAAMAPLCVQCKVMLQIQTAEMCQGTGGRLIQDGVLNRHRKERAKGRITADELCFYCSMVFTTCVDSG